MITRHRLAQSARRLSLAAAVAVAAVAIAAPPASAVAVGTIVNFAGSAAGTFGNTGDGGPATSATFNTSVGVAVDAAGNVYVADAGNNRVRKVDTSGTITNFAGSAAGTAGNTGDLGPATSATLSNPEGVAVDAAGNVYVVDAGNNRVRKVDAGTITNFAGSAAGTAGNTGDGGPGTSATLSLSSGPSGVAVDAAGNVYIADVGNHRVRKVATSGTITNFAGSSAGTQGNAGDGGPATSATLDGPSGVAVDGAGNLYVADHSQARVRKVDTSGTITDFAGVAGTGGNAGDGGPATSATLNNPTDVATDAGGNVYIADNNNNRVRKVDTSGTITDFAGSSAGTPGNTGDGGPATSATLHGPRGVAADATGDVYVTDSFNFRVREVLGASAVPVARALPALALGAPVLAAAGGVLAWRRRRAGINGDRLSSDHRPS